MRTTLTTGRLAATARPLTITKGTKAACRAPTSSGSVAGRARRSAPSSSPATTAAAAATFSSSAPGQHAPPPRTTTPPTSPPAATAAPPPPWPQPRLAAAAALAVLLSLASPAPVPKACASAGEKLGEFAASGLVFKDSVEVSALADRDLPGVTIFVSDFKRSLTDKLSKDFFAEPSQASISCALDAAGATALASEPTAALERRLGGSGGEGRELFAERKGLNVFKNKTLRVRRLFDADRRVAVYVAYSTRLGTAGDEGGGVSTGRYRTSICAVPLPAYAGAGAEAAEGQQAAGP